MAQATTPPVAQPASEKGTELRLTPTARMPRKLVVSWGDHSVTAMVFAERVREATLLAVATAPCETCSLAVFQDDRTGGAFVVGDASFDVTKTEAEILAATFGGRGLRIGKAPI